MPQISKVAGEMALSMLAYNWTRVMNTVGIKQTADLGESRLEINPGF